MGRLFIIVGILITHASFSQRITIHGNVVDGFTLDNLANVHVFLEEHIGTTTDIDGRFQFSVNYLDTLHFTAIGYNSLSIVIDNMDKVQRLILSMRRSTIILEPVEIASYFQVETIIKRKEPIPMQVSGVKYSNKSPTKNYNMGLAAVASPITALYRMFSKSYKEEKKNYQYLKQKAIDDAIFAKAKKKLDTSFEQIDSYLDDYYYRDFIMYSGLTLRVVAESSEYELIKILPQAVKDYYRHLEEIGK